MDKEKVRQVTLEELKNIDPKLINYMTFTDGTVAMVDSDDEGEDNENMVKQDKYENKKNLQVEPDKEANEQIVDNNVNENNNEIDYQNEENNDMNYAQDNNEINYENHNDNMNDNFDGENEMNYNLNDNNENDMNYNENNMDNNGNYVNNMNNENEMNYENNMNNNNENEINYENRINPNMNYMNDDIQKNNINYQNEIKDNHPNNMNLNKSNEKMTNMNAEDINNISYGNQNSSSEKKINENTNDESNIIEKEKNIKVQEIMVGDRRMERFDGAEYNSNPNLDAQKGAQFYNNQFLNPVQQMNIQGYNNSNINSFNNHNTPIPQNQLNNNMIMNQPQLQQQLQYQNMNLPFQNNSPHPNQDSLNQIPNQAPNQFLLNQNQNDKSGKNTYSPKNNVVSGRTTFIVEKNNEYINNNLNNNYQTNENYQNAIKNTKINQMNRNEQKNINVNVLYPNPGYGNTEEKQKQLKKKKIIKYVRRLKPVVEQHFDVQIIQNQQEPEYPQMYQQYLQEQKFYAQPSLVSIPQRPFPQNQYKYQNRINNFPSNQNRNISPIQQFCNCPKSFQEYNPIINNNSIHFRPYFEEQERNRNRLKCTCKPRQTLINITPMRTITEPNIYEGNIRIPYNSEIRRFRTEENLEYRPMTPMHHSKFERRHYGFENNYNEYNYGNRGRRKNSYSFYPQKTDYRSVIHFYDENEEYNSELNCPCCIYEKRMRMKNNY